MNRWAWIGLCLVAVPAWGGEAPPTFTRKPTAAKAGDRVKIEFAVDRETDVAVFIENGGGKVVRHLVAGALGKNPPPPLKPGLAQTLEWDGKGDYGKPLPSLASGGGGFKVRVALGLGAKYDKLVASAPEDIGRPMGLGLGPGGTLYVIAQGGYVVNWDSRMLHAFNRDGSYQRTLIPMPADATREKIAFLGGAPVEVAGRPVPAVTNLQKHMTTAFWPELGGTMAAAPDGTLLVPQDAMVCAVPPGNALPAGGYAGARISAAGKPADFGGGAALVISGDGKWVYATGLVSGSGKSQASVPTVFRVKYPERSGAEPFFGDPAAAGSDEKHLASPCGLALDGKGHLLIADREGNRVVAVSEKDGSFAGALAVDKPEAVAADPKSGAVYVVQLAGKGAADLVKFSGWKDARQLGKVPLATASADPKYLWRLALDVSAAPAVLWACHTKRGLLRAEDDGAKLGSPAPVSKGEGAMFGNMAFLDVVADNYRPDPEVYVRTYGGDSGYGWVRFSEAAGKFENLVLQKFITGAAGTCIVPGPDGNLYALHESLPAMFKFDRAGKPLPWDEPRPADRDLARPGGENRYIERYTKMGADAKYASFARVCMVYMTHTMGVRPDGHIFVFERSPQFDHRHSKALYEYAPSGKRIGGPIIWEVSDAAVGPKFDQEGNIYVAEHIKPAGQPVPPEYAGAKGGKESAASIYGSIVKFGPKGGAIDLLEPKLGKPYEGEAKLDASLKTVDAVWSHGGASRPAKVTGAEWVRLGVSHMEYPGFSCNCENIRFEVDPFGRVWYPDLGRYRVGVLDTAGNELLHFGGYGNAESCGPESRNKKLAEPDLAFSWLTGVGATDKYAYVGDALNRRLLRARLVYAAEETCALP